MAPKDFKERPARKPSPRHPRKSAGAARWPWFGAGVCAGAIATAAMFLYEPGSSGHGPAAGPARASAGTSESGAPRFEFYTLLPEKEIAVPDAELERTSAPPAPKLAAPPAAADEPVTPDSGRYLLQVASFRKFEDADRLKARLAFMGLESRIQTVSIDGAESWHRVRVGPYAGRGELAEARAKLKQNGLDSMVLKLK